MKKRKPRVGIYGYSPTDPRIVRIVEANEQRVVWIAPFDDPEMALREVKKSPPDILVVNPRYSGRLAGFGWPEETIMVIKTNPFGERVVDLTPGR